MKRGGNIAILLGIPAWAFILLSPHAAAAPVMVEKNLFAQDRRPPSTETATPAPQANRPGLSPKALQLDGVFMHGEVKKALIRVKSQLPGASRDKGQSPFMTVREGETVADFRVVKIEPKSISLEKDGQTFVVGLFAEGKIAPPAPAAPPGQPRGPANAGAANAPRVLQPMAPQDVNRGPEPGQGDPGAAMPQPVPDTAVAAPDPGGQAEDPSVEEEVVDDEEVPEDANP